MTRQDDIDSVGQGPAGPVLAATIDARGLACPLPLLRAKQGLNRAACGERIKVLATDSGSVRDFHSFAALSGNQLLHFSEAAGVYTYVLEKHI